MTPNELSARQSRARAETFVISRTEEGLRVYSPTAPAKSYLVTGNPDEPACTCPDFQHHQEDPEWRCKHILAVLNQRKQGAATAAEGNGEEATSPPPQKTSPTPRKRRSAQPTSDTTQMTLKRSVSPDGRIDSLSIEFTRPVAELLVEPVEDQARLLLNLQDRIAGEFLEMKRGAPADPPPPQVDPRATPAQLLNVAGMNSQWGRRLYLNVQVNGHVFRLFGNRNQLAEAIVGAGYAQLAGHLEEGAQLNVPCRVTTKSSRDGRYTNIDQVFPPGASPSGGRP